MRRNGLFLATPERSRSPHPSRPGATGSGKTHTLLGGRGCGGDGGDDPGVIARAGAALFAEARSRAAAGGAVAVVAQCVEVYNEQVFDLLAPPPPQRPQQQQQQQGWDRAAAGDGRVPLPLGRAPDGSAVACGAVSAPLADEAALAAVVAAAGCARRTGATLVNARSSRSHLVLALALRCTPAPPPGRARAAAAASAAHAPPTEGALYLVDLAGSERLSRSGAEGGAKAETSAINASLSALAGVVAALAARAPHVPYRDSVLTRLLSPALGPGGRVLLLAAVAPEAQCAGETLCTLRFAAKAAACELAQPQQKGEIGGLLGAATARKA